MGVVVRQQKRDNQWYIWIRHAGQRAAKRYESQEEAEAVATAIRNKIALGEFDIAALIAAKAATPVKTEPQDPDTIRFRSGSSSKAFTALVSKMHMFGRSRIFLVVLKIPPVASSGKQYPKNRKGRF